MYKPWKVGTDIFSYLDIFLTSDLWGKGITIKRKESKCDVYVGNKIIKSGNTTTIGQFLRVCDFLGILKKNRGADKIENYYNGSVELKIIESKANLNEYILENIYSKTKKLFDATDEEYIKEIFPHGEEKFLFSIASTIIVMVDKANSKFIEMQMDGTRVSDYSLYYKKLSQYLSSTKNIDYLEYIKSVLVKGKDEVQKIVDNTTYPNKKLMDIYRSVNVGKELEFNTYSFGSFIKTHLQQSSKIKIPIYQRKYRWSDLNILKLVRDISLTKNIEKPFHNIGTMVTKHVPLGTHTVIKIIDGQQRLTSLLIIFRAAFDIASYNDWSIESLAYDKFKIITSDIDDEKVNDVVETFLRIDGNDDFKAFTDLMIGNKDSGVANSIIFRNYYSVLGWMTSNLKTNDDMIEFWASLTKSIIFAAMTDKTSNEFTLFEKLNTGAIPLTVMELIKNKILNIFSEVVDKNEGSFQLFFQNKILKHFEIKKGKKKGEIDEAKVNQFIINILRVYGIQYNGTGSLYESYNNIVESIYVSRVENFSHKRKDSFKDLLSEMEKDIIFFNEITDSSLYMSSGSRFKHFSDYLFSFDNRTIYFPILYKIFKNYEKTNKGISDINFTRRLLHSLETFEIRFQVVSYRGQSLADTMQHISESIATDTTPKDIMELFKDEKLKSITMPKLELFGTTFKTFKFNNKLANIISIRFENYIKYNGIEIEKGSEPILVSGADAKISREHIMPQEKKNWLETLLSKYTDKSLSEINSTYDDIVDFIGNALPIKVWKNSSLGAVSMKKKIKKYSMNKVIPSLSMYGGFEFKGIKIETIKEDFDFDTINLRSKQFAKLAKIIWGD